MTPERWKQVEALFHAALARPEPERSTFLDAACAEDIALRDEVGSLLARQPTSFLSEPAMEIAAGMVGDAGSSQLTGRQLGSYRIQAPIGAGGMGEVYRARDLRLGRDVAIKVLRRTFPADHDRRARFDREARILATLNHPQIASIYGVEDVPDGTCALVLELVEGPTLADRLARGRLSVEEALDLAVQIADALGAAHDRGVIHRDLKPANIKVTPEGRVKVLDFGLAKLVAGDVEGADPSDATRVAGLTTDRTREGVLLGTAPYMSPEQARGQTVDKRTDIWAFGCVLFEMLAGRRAFLGETVTDAIASIIEREPDWKSLPENVPHNVRSVLRRCLQKDSKRRLHDIADARLELEEADSEERGTNASTARAKTVKSQKTRMAVASSLLVGVILGGVVVDRLMEQRRDASLRSAQASGAEPARLVVLPFENLSRQPDDDWLAGAFADSLTLGLQDAENIILVNRERLLEVNRNRNPDPRQVSQALGARYYVNGSFQRVADDLKVVARLVEVDGGTIKVQESFTDRFGNLLHIEDDLARRFVSALQQAHPGPTRLQTASIPAYKAVAEATDLYLTGRYREAVQRLRGALARDDKYAEAWALLAKSYARLFNPNSVESGTRGDFLREALRASQHAIDLDPSLYDAHVALAATYQQLEHVESWRIAAQKAIELNPRLPDGYVVLGDSYSSSPVYGCARQRDPALAENFYRKAVQLNPYFAAARNRLISHLFWSGSGAAALDEAEAGLRLLPQNLSLQQSRAFALLWLGRTDELERQLHELATQELTDSIVDQWAVAVIPLFRGDLDQAAARFQAVIARGPLTLREIDTGRVYAQVGRMKDASKHLQRAFDADPACAGFVAGNGAFAPYRKDPTLRALLSRYPGRQSS